MAITKAIEHHWKANVVENLNLKIYCLDAFKLNEYSPKTMARHSLNVKMKALSLDSDIKFITLFTVLDASYRFSVSIGPKIKLRSS